MLRITQSSNTPEEVILKVEGWLSGPDVDLLEQEITQRVKDTSPVILDLTHTRFIDDKGIRLLQRRAGESVRLDGASAFIRELLRAHGLSDGVVPNGR